MRARREAIPVPTESQEQQALFQWAALHTGRYPELALMYHIPNEGLRNPRTGARMKAEGMKPGVPDVCLPVARGGFHGLYIEMKRTKGGRVEPGQREWLGALNGQGYAAVVCLGWEKAAQMIEAYLLQKRSAL